MIDTMKSAKNLFVMGYHNDGGVLFVRNRFQKVHHGPSAFGVQRGRWFVCEDDARIIGQRTRDGDPLRFAARKIGGHGIFTMIHPKIAQKLPTSIAGL